jgi:hypothetical protein
MSDTERPERCSDCDAAARHAYSDATTPGFFFSTCARHRHASAPEVKPAGAHWFHSDDCDCEKCTPSGQRAPESAEQLWPKWLLSLIPVMTNRGSAENAISFAEAYAAERVAALARALKREKFNSENYRSASEKAVADLAVAQKEVERLTNGIELIMAAQIEMSPQKWEQALNIVDSLVHPGVAPAQSTDSGAEDKSFRGN